MSAFTKQSFTLTLCKVGEMSCAVVHLIKMLQSPCFNTGTEQMLITVSDLFHWQETRYNTKKARFMVLHFWFIVPFKQ